MEDIFSFDEEFEAEVVFDFGVAGGDNGVEGGGRRKGFEEGLVEGFGAMFNVGLVFSGEDEFDEASIGGEVKEFPSFYLFIVESFVVFGGGVVEDWMFFERGLDDHLSF